jgi:hypothetical protein
MNFQKDFHTVPAPEGLVSSHVCHQHGNIPRDKHKRKRKKRKLDREKKMTDFYKIKNRGVTRTKEKKKNIF